MISEVLKAKRKALKKERGNRYTIKAVAKRVGVTEAYLCNVENNRELPSPERILLLARELDIDVDYLQACAGRLSKNYSDALSKDKRLYDTSVQMIENSPTKTVVHNLIAQISALPDGEWINIDEIPTSFVDLLTKLLLLSNQSPIDYVPVEKLVEHALEKPSDPNSEDPSVFDVIESLFKIKENHVTKYKTLIDVMLATPTELREVRKQLSQPYW